MLGGEAVSQVYDDGKSFDLTVKTSDAAVPRWMILAI